MKRIIRKATCIMTILLVAILVVGCSKFDIDGYVKAVLDVNFKDETKEYIKITKESQSAADAIYKENANKLFISFCSGMDVSKNITKRGEQVFGDILKSTKYTVGKAQKDGKSYKVEVTFHQVKVFSDAIPAYTTQVEAYIDGLQDQALEGKEVPTDQEINDHVVTILLDLLQETMDYGVTYGEDKVLTIHVKKNESTYEIDDADYRLIMSYAMDIDDIK